MAAVLRKSMKYLSALTLTGVRIGRRAETRKGVTKALFKSLSKSLMGRGIGNPHKAPPRLSVVCIGATTASLGTQGLRNQVTLKKRAKKRLGDHELYPHLTQSLTLSHINKKLNTVKSSEKIYLILDDDFFHFVDIEAPNQIPTRELEAMFTWALKEKGFAPLEDWLWDIYQYPSADDPHYYVALLQRQQAEFYLERLALTPAQVACLQPAKVVRSSHPVLSNSLPFPPVQGPWLDFEQLNVLLARLHQPCAEVNLLTNTATRSRRQFQTASIECAAALLLGIAVAYAWWPQHPPNYLLPAQLSLPSPTTTHPLLAHEPLWRALQQLDHTEVGLHQVEFQRGRWQISMRARDLMTGQASLEAFTQALDDSWHVRPVSIRSGGQGSGQATIVELEVSQ